MTRTRRATRGRCCFWAGVLARQDPSIRRQLSAVPRNLPTSGPARENRLLDLVSVGRCLGQHRRPGRGALRHRMHRGQDLAPGCEHRGPHRFRQRPTASNRWQRLGDRCGLIGATACASVTIVGCDLGGNSTAGMYWVDGLTRNGHRCVFIAPSPRGSPRRAVYPGSDSPEVLRCMGQQQARAVGGAGGRALYSHTRLRRGKVARSTRAHAFKPDFLMREPV
jgi:hypothetical protein